MIECPGPGEGGENLSPPRGGYRGDQMSSKTSRGLKNPLTNYLVTFWNFNFLAIFPPKRYLLLNQTSPAGGLSSNAPSYPMAIAPVERIQISPNLRWG